MPPRGPIARALDLLGHLTTHRRLTAILVIATMALCLPGLFGGYQLDDHMHQAILQGTDPAAARPPVSELFAFMDGDPEHNRRLQDLGVVPWWSDPDIKARFWRPLTAATHVLDDRIARGNAVLAHAHSIVWMVALVLAAWALFRRVHGPTRVAGLAAFIYAVDEAHGIPVGWLANRNALVAGVFGILTLLLYDRLRRTGWRLGWLLAPFTLLLSLLAGESGIATTAWLFAYAVFLDGRRSDDDSNPSPRPSLVSRLAHLVPFAIVVVAWRAVYSARGYGTHGSGLYLDPVTDPLPFLASGPRWMVALLADQFVGFPAVIVSLFEPGLQLLVLGLAAMPVLLLAWLGHRVLRGSPHAGFWLTGTLLSAVPIATTFPAARLLTFVGLGGAALVAMFVDRVLLRGAIELDAPRLTRPVGWLLLILHLPVAALLLPTQVWSPVLIASLIFNPCDDGLPHDPSITEKTAVFVNSNDLCVAYVRYRRLTYGLPAPAHTRLLASALYEIELTGIDAHTLDIHVPAGMHSSSADQLLRTPDVPLAIGSIQRVEGMSFEVLSWNDGGFVDVVRLRSDVPLKDPSLIWRCLREVTYLPFEPPAPGETVRVGPSPWTQSTSPHPQGCGEP